MKPRIAIINRYGPGSHSATGYHASALAKHLVETDEFTLDFYCVQGDAQNSHIKTITSRHFYTGKHRIKRFLTSLYESISLLWRARKTKADWYIVLTDPPFLNFFATILLPRQRTILWTMDLYPEALVAARLVSYRDILMRYYRHRLKQNPPAALFTLGSQQHQYLRQSYYPNVKAISLPIGLQYNPSHKGIAPPDWYIDKSVIHFAYIGNMGEAHSIDFLIQFAQTLDPRFHRLVLRLYGAHAQEMITTLQDLPTVVCVDYVTDPELAWIDVQLVSLSLSWTHICVPSKALTALQYGHAILFYGSRKSDTWRYVQDAGWHIGPEVESLSESIDNYLKYLTLDDIQDKKNQSTIQYKKLRAQYEQGVCNIIQFLKSPNE